MVEWEVHSNGALGRLSIELKIVEYCLWNAPGVVHYNHSQC